MIIQAGSALPRGHPTRIFANPFFQPGAVRIHVRVRSVFRALLVVPWLSWLSCLLCPALFLFLLLVVVSRALPRITFGEIGNSGGRA